MGRHTTVRERELIIQQFNRGKSYREIGDLFQKSHATVQHIVERYKRENRLINKKRKSPKKILSDADERWILRYVKKNPRMSAPKIASEVENYLKMIVSAETVRRVLRKHNFHGRVARKKPFISKKNQKDRLKFANEHISKDFDFWKKFIFADESKFNIFGSDGRGYVWRKPGEAFSKQNLLPTVKHGGGSVMVWGCMAASGVGNLHFIEGIMDKHLYVDILRQNLKVSVEKLGLKDIFTFYQDNDPKHSSLIVKEWLTFNCPKLIKTPAQSPDLNVIEHLWAKLETEIRKHNITNKENLKKALLEEWEKITPDFTQKLVESIPNRLREVINNKGLPTRY